MPAAAFELRDQLGEIVIDNLPLNLFSEGLIDGRLRVSAEDAARLGLVDGARAVITTARGSAEAMVEVTEAMQAGHASLPNGFGLCTGPDGESIVTGVAPNSLTASEWRDEFAGTPWHKHVPASIEPAPQAA